MADYWITIQVDPQRTRDIRIDADAYAEFVKRRGGKRYKVIAVRPCQKDNQQT